MPGRPQAFLYLDNGVSTVYAKQDFLLRRLWIRHFCFGNLPEQEFPQKKNDNKILL